MILFAPTAAHPRTTLKVVWLSGASDLFSSTLSDAEIRLLEAFELQRDEVVWSNFPYAGPQTRRRIPLPLAGLSNVLQFLAASTPVYRWLAARHWRALCASASCVLVVAGSCGAQLLRALEHATPDDVAVHALALGPMAWRAPRCLKLSLIGTDDDYSRVFARALPPERVEDVAGVDHMSYLASGAVRDRVRAWVLAHRAAYLPTGGAA